MPPWHGAKASVSSITASAAKICDCVPKPKAQTKKEEKRERIYTCELIFKPQVQSEKVDTKDPFANVNSSQVE